MIFLKLGGSLITDKTRPNTARREVIQRLAQEIAAARREDAELQLIVGHGSGSFGHAAAARHQTPCGSAQDQEAFLEIWRAARQLHDLMMESLSRASLPVVSFPPSACAICRDGDLAEMNVEPIGLALKAGLVPVVYGDICFDIVRGSAIVSTETVLAYLSETFTPQRLLLAGLHDVYAQETGGRQPVKNLNDERAATLTFAPPEGADVTGGMAGKVADALELSRRFPRMEIRIFSAQAPNVLRDALLGATPGTRVQAVA